MSSREALITQYCVPMRSLPTGTLTLLFSDIEGSTSLVNSLGPLWGEALSEQRRLLREAFTAHGGVELGTEGDSFFIVFTSAAEAVLAAVEAQRALGSHEWPTGRAVRVRMGIHTGEPQRHEDGYIGLDVHRAARIAATAAGGQIVVSEATRSVLGALAGGIELRDLGWHRLKDLPRPEHLFDIAAEGLSGEHPALRSLGTLASLPSYATDLIGRTLEITELSDALVHGTSRLITLTGPGGTGKTRLAVSVARELQNQLSCDIFFVPLHAADREALMWAGIAEAVGAPADADRAPSERVVDFLRDRRTFLILDNLEQVSGADAVVGRLLSDVPRVTILATSRRPLHLVEEQQYPVSTLAVPTGKALRSLLEAQTGAVDLFVRRARMVQPRFALTTANVGDVVALCRLLDGLPLAIELAAARSRLLSPKALLKRIDDSFGETETLTNRVARQRTLAGTIAWSYDLLDPLDQGVFRTLGVFSSRFDLDAVQSVAGTDERDPLDVVAHLVDVSLVQIVDGPDGEPMVWLLETIRRFARHRLREAREYDEARMRHARWCLEQAAQVCDLLNGPKQMTALDRMGAIEEDVRSALDWCFTPGAADQSERLRVGLSLLEAMYAYWYRFGYIAEGREWHDRALGILGTGAVADSPQVVDALHGQGVMALQQNDLLTGSQSLQRALDMAHRLGDRHRESRESNSLGIARREAGDVEAARALIESSLELARLIDDPQREATALSNMVHVHMDAGDYPAAVAAAREAIAADTALNDPWGVAISQCNLISALLNAEGPRRAYEQLTASAASIAGLGDVELSIDLIEAASMIWAELGDAPRTARLLGATEAHREKVGIPRGAPDQRHLDRFLAPAREALSEAQWRQEFDAGRGIGLEEAVAQAVEPAQVPRAREGGARVSRSGGALLG